MHRAPAVNFTVKRSRWQARLIACLGLLALAILAVFAQGQAVLDVRTGVVALAILVTCSLAFLGWRQSPQGSLRWDGQHWHWSGFPDNTVCRLGLLMDLQSVVVVTLKAETQSSISLWLETTCGDANWKALRRAIVSSQADSDGKRQKAGPGAAGDLA
jgi:toxin CptA